MKALKYNPYTKQTKVINITSWEDISQWRLSISMGIQKKVYDVYFDDEGKILIMNEDEEDISSLDVDIETIIKRVS